MAVRRHELVPDKRLISQIDYIYPKLKYSVHLWKIIQWLENFEKEDIDKAIDFLFFLEYIDNAELTFRLNEQLSKVFKTIPSTYNIFIVPGVATYPKSTEVISYILKDTPAYKECKKKKHCLITRDLQKDIVINKDTAIIFFDDFVGSGGSFEKGYDKKTGLKTWLDSNPDIKSRFLISSICMAQGKLFIENKYPEIQIFAEIRDRLFSHQSPFLLKNNIAQMREFAIKYGKVAWLTNPLGFESSEALIVFSHTTPNNTLPIIWCNNTNWYPIFPRIAEDKIMQSKTLKKNAAFYLGIMNRLGLDLFTNKRLKVKGKRNSNNNQPENHSLLCVVKLKLDAYEMPFICQLLGITTGEYDEIIKYGQEKELLNHDGSLSTNGISLYKRLMQNSPPKRLLSKKKDDFQKEFIPYVPKTFKGIS